ncbi:MAG: hypothetical protein ACPGJV_14830 [Bacteriovoracaceae bacterium]
METIRQFKRMSLWDFIDLMEENCLNSGKATTYFMYLDEIKMRRIESISEGGNVKLKKLANQLLQTFKEEKNKDSEFCTDQEFNDFVYTVQNEI